MSPPLCLCGRAHALACFASHVISSNHLLFPPTGRQVAKRIEELSDEEVASMEEARDNLVPFLEYKAAQPQ